MQPIVNVLSVDVEDYFHPTEVQRVAGPESWESLPSRVECATERVLELLEAAGARATFFVLGWVAERRPALVKRIAAAGHEIGCHSFGHRLVYKMTPGEFRADTLRAKRAIEDACGLSPRLYRAPSFSITRRSWWALEALAECGFEYDSSIYPIRHDRYGIPGFHRFPCRVETPSGSIIEVPVATVKLSRRRVAPVGGGAYLRLLPYRYTQAGIRRLNEIERRPACVYFHPWEMDPEQPRLLRSAVSRWRTYRGLGSMRRKLARLFDEFRFAAMSEVVPAEAVPAASGGRRA